MTSTMHDDDKTPQDVGASQVRDLVGGQRERRERFARAREFAKEVETWPSWKLRAAYAQPERVRRAEEREKGEARSSGK